jgi:hypothetical protein
MKLNQVGAELLSAAKADRPDEATSVLSHFCEHD